MATLGTTIQGVISPNSGAVGSGAPSQPLDQTGVLGLLSQILGQGLSPGLLGQLTNGQGGVSPLTAPNNVNQNINGQVMSVPLPPSWQMNTDAGVHDSGMAGSNAQSYVDARARDYPPQVPQGLQMAAIQGLQQFQKGLSGQGGKGQPTPAATPPAQGPA